MSHLFNMFVKQVQDYCGSLSMPDCNKVLLVYGLTNLAKMEEESLDKMDPYQRGATDIIWESMMKGSYKTPSNTKEPLDYSYISGNGPSPSSGGNTLGSQEEASTNVEQYLTAIPNVPNKYVIGPMVVRVLPDGRPVPGDSERPLPKDEDAEEFKLMRSKPAPSVEELMNRRPYQQELRPPMQQSGPSYNGRYQQSVLPITETQQQKKSSSEMQAVYVPPPSQFRIPAL
ncbi:Rhythmically expressed gene 5 protein [Zootermopsis nevadensis]|uniref:Rhythmically expressed gene 5 protein n=2 Tax=Zootermopsis nevadensis TaxID=136037 RepID=A0A067QNV0_ZOONE|nr:Rhythmically expressed gene 5 protein [Zootermopsis nevadensis]